eukprot:13977562-Alexandrium_andersonii.AAC.1
MGTHTLLRATSHAEARDCEMTMRPPSPAATPPHRSEEHAQSMLLYTKGMPEARSPLPPQQAVDLPSEHLQGDTSEPRLP